MPTSLKSTLAPLWRASRSLFQGMLDAEPVRARLTPWQWPTQAVRILTYHTIGRDDEPMDAWTVVRRSDFLKQIAILRSRFSIVDLDTALEGRVGLRPQVVLTFDDGHRSWLEHLLPIVRREALPVTLYVATGHIESGRAYWFDRMMNALQVAEPTRIDLSSRQLGTYTIGADVGRSNWQRISELLERLKQQPLDVREAVTDDIEHQLHHVPRRAVEPISPLTPKEVRELAEQPGITLGAHSHCHCLLDQLDVADALASVDRSRKLLHEWTGRQVLHFAFPNGNYSLALARGVEQLSFKSAATSEHGVWVPGRSCFTLHRLNVGRYDDVRHFAHQLTYG
jgi:peptidoglycan/xylan/chitin deacetylase (PgdA/CDA1 family)